jgi:hypothetical protein
MRAPDGWESPRFQAGFWLEVDSAKVAFSRPAHPRVTHTVGRSFENMVHLNMKIFAAFKLYIFIVFLIAIATGCSNKASPSTDISTLIDIGYQTGPEISAGDTVEAWMENMSNQCVSFPLDFNIRVFVEQHGNWVEVSNRVDYLGDRPQVLKPKGDMPSSALVYIRPDTSGLSITEPVNSYALA